MPTLASFLFNFCFVDVVVVIWTTYLPGRDKIDGQLGSLDQGHDPIQDGPPDPMGHLAWIYVYIFLVGT